MEFAPKVRTDLKTKRLSGHNYKIKCLDWDCSGTYIASGSRDGSVKVWSIQNTKEPVYSFSLSKAVLQVKWNPTDRNILACCIERDTLLILNVEQQETVLTVKLSGHPDYLSWSPDGKYVAVMNDRGVVFIIDAVLGDYTTVKNETCPNGNRTDICWGMDSSSLFVSAGENGVGCIEVIMKNQVTNEYEFDRSFQCSMCELTTIDMDRKHHNIAVGSVDSLVTIIDCYEMIAISTLKCQKTAIKRVRWTGNGDYIAICSSDNVISVLHPILGDYKVVFPISQYSTVFAFHPSKHSAAVVMGKNEKEGATVIDIVQWKYYCLL